MIQSIRWWWCPMSAPPKKPRIICRWISWRLRSPMIISLKTKYMAVIAQLLVRWIFHRRNRHRHNLILNLCHKGSNRDLMKPICIINLIYMARCINWFLLIILMKVLVQYSLDTIMWWIKMAQTSWNCSSKLEKLMLISPFILLSLLHQHWSISEILFHCLESYCGHRHFAHIKLIYPKNYPSQN